MGPVKLSLVCARSVRWKLSAANTKNASGTSIAPMTIAATQRHLLSVMT
jgi:hypothetical protein